jgi:hypothetical protein
MRESNSAIKVSLIANLTGTTLRALKRRHGELIACLITLATLTCTAAQAEPPRVDWFSIRLPSFGTPKPVDPKLPSDMVRPRKTTVTPPPKATKAATKIEGSAATIWFKQYDELVKRYRPTPADRVILSRPLMQEEERVHQWTNTASKISKNYLQFTKTLKQVPLPAELSDVHEYRDLTIDWYHDAALIFDEMIRPRAPAKTIEELQRQLDQVKNRSETLASTMSSLSAMDHDLRKRYNINGVNDPEEITPNGDMREFMHQTSGQASK